MTRRRYNAGVPTTLWTDVTATATSFQISNATGWPSGSGDDFWVTIDAGTAKEERLLCTSVSGSSAPYTVSVKSTPSYTAGRGKDGTTATSHASGATVWPSWSATDADEANAHVNATSGVHGISGDVVGTSDSQALTSKAIALGSNTITGTKAQFNAAMTDADFATLAGTETLTNKTVQLGSNTVTGTIAEFNTAVTDADLATLAGTETLTNKTISGPTLSGTVAGSPTFSGTVSAPTAAADTNTTQVATTAFVVGQAGSGTPVTIAGTAVTGTSKKYSREDHTHVGVTSVNSVSGAVTLGSWTSFTPSMYGSATNPTIGNTTFNCAYTVIGKLVFVTYNVVLGSTFSNGSGTYTFSLPSGYPIATGKLNVSGAGQIRDSSASDQYRATMVPPAATDRTGILMISDAVAQGSAFGATSFTAPAVNDSITFSFFYETA